MPYLLIVEIGFSTEFAFPHKFLLMAGSQPDGGVKCAVRKTRKQMLLMMLSTNLTVVVVYTTYMYLTGSVR